MNYEQLIKLINGETVKIGKKNNQIYLDKETGLFIVEMYEFTSDLEGEMFSVGDSFNNLEIAILTATRYTGDTYNYEVQQRLLKQFA